MIILFLSLTACDQTTGDQDRNISVEQWPADDEIEPIAGNVKKFKKQISKGRRGIDYDADFAPREIPPVPKKEAGDDILDQLSNAKISFAIPSKSNVDDVIYAELIVTPEELEEIIRHSIHSDRVINSDILISMVMIAEIKTNDFNITHITPKEQALSGKESTVWLWKLDPIESGKKSVILTITAIVNTDLKTSKRHIKTFEKTVLIDITHTQQVKKFINTNWQWLWSVILVPLVLIVVRYIKK